MSTLLTTLAAASQHIKFEELGLSAVALDLGFFEIKWYSLAYIAGILIGWWYMLRLLRAPGAPMSRRHADDLVFYATLGIILGGRLGYVIFYKPEMFLTPLQILKLWDGGMSFHGGVIGTTLAILWLARKNRLNWLRIHDYVACCAPVGLLLGRIANFVNGELWGKPANLGWAIVFPGAGPLARHPSQIYEALLEGLVLFVILWWLFWRTDARYQPGKLVGAFLLGYGAFRFFVEFYREPDEQLVWLANASGLHMGQWLCMPMLVGGAWLIATAKKRGERVVPYVEPAPAAAAAPAAEAPAVPPAEPESAG